jgi:hypothetical protein
VRVDAKLAAASRRRTISVSAMSWPWVSIAKRESSGVEAGQRVERCPDQTASLMFMRFPRRCMPALSSFLAAAAKLLTHSARMHAMHDATSSAGRCGEGIYGSSVLSQVTIGPPPDSPHRLDTPTRHNAPRQPAPHRSRRQRAQ